MILRLVFLALTNYATCQSSRITGEHSIDTWRRFAVSGVKVLPLDDRIISRLFSVEVLVFIGL